MSDTRLNWMTDKEYISYMRKHAASSPVIQGLLDRWEATRSETATHECKCPVCETPLEIDVDDTGVATANVPES